MSASATHGGAQVALSDRVRQAQDKARVLREALPWITRWSGRTVVVKFGGNAMSDPRLPGALPRAPHPSDEEGDEAPLAQAFAADIALLRSVGLRVVVVHGGGPQISSLGARMGLEATFVDGRRVTDAATLAVVKMALLGQVNPWLVGLIDRAGARAVGLAGTDARLISAVPAEPALGRVGEVAAVDAGVLTSLLDDGAVPVVATLGRDRDGREYNINADTVAGAIAVGLRADKLIYLTNVPGLYEDFGTATSTLLSEVSVQRLETMLAAGELHTGMVPKVGSIVHALSNGVSQAHLLDGRVEHALLLEIFTDAGVGTMVVGAHDARATMAES